MDTNHQAHHDSYRNNMDKDWRKQGVDTCWRHTPGMQIISALKKSLAEEGLRECRNSTPRDMPKRNEVCPLRCCL